ncbi:unnamed protein product, partial [Ceratitis capitata]
CHKNLEIIGRKEEKKLDLPIGLDGSDQAEMDSKSSAIISPRLKPDNVIRDILVPCLECDYPNNSCNQTITMERSAASKTRRQHASHRNFLVRTRYIVYPDAAADADVNFRTKSSTNTSWVLPETVIFQGILHNLSGFDDFDHRHIVVML